MKVYEFLARMMVLDNTHPKHLLGLFQKSKEGKKIEEAFNKKLYTITDISCMHCCNNPTYNYILLLHLNKFKVKSTMYFNVVADMVKTIKISAHGNDKVDILHLMRNFLLNTNVSQNMYAKLMKLEKKHG